MPDYSEHLKQQRQEEDRRFTRRIGKAVIGVVLTGAALTTGFIVGRDSAKDAPSKAEAIHIAQIEADNRAGAEQVAKIYETELNDNLNVEQIHLPILSGNVRDSNDNGRYEHRDPILLSTYNEDGTLHTDSKGKFLNGAFIGVAGSDGKGHVTINVLPYDTSVNTFEPNDPVHPILYVGAYVSQGKYGPEIYAFDTTRHQTLKNTDNSPMVIGELHDTHSA